MRPLPLLLLALLAAPAALPAADVTLVRVWPGWRAADSFSRLSEYFSGLENDGGQTVLRSQPAERGGYYFLVRTQTDAAVPGARVELQVLLPGVEKPRTFTFPAALPAGSHVTLAGLTGSDWPGAKTAPIAWHLAVLDPKGAVLATTQSFLWAKPAAAVAAK